MTTTRTSRRKFTTEFQAKVAMSRHGKPEMINSDQGRQLVATPEFGELAIRSAISSNEKTLLYLQC